MDLTMEKLVVNADRLRGAFTPDIFAADRALELVTEGVPFREAYRRVGKELTSLENKDPVEAITRRTSIGAPGNLMLQIPRSQAEGYEKDLSLLESEKRAKITNLAGREVELFRDPLAGNVTSAL